MKVLKNQGQVLQIINRKLNELRKKFDEADGEEASEISGQGPRSSASRCTFATCSRAVATSERKTWRTSMTTSTTLKIKTASTVIPEILGS